MIDASATAIGRGPIAVTGLKNNGSQEDGGAQEQGFGDYLDEASAGSAGSDDIAGDASGQGSAYASTEAGDVKLTRSIINLFATVPSRSTTTQLANAESTKLPVVASDVATQPLPGAGGGDAAGKAELSLLAQTLGLEADELAALLANANGGTSDEQLSAIIGQLQESGDIAVPEEDAPAVSDEDLALAMMFAEDETNETAGPAHHLLSALSKALREEAGEETSVDEQLSETGEDAASTTSLLGVGQNVAPTIVKTADSADAPLLRGGDSAKDALAQISAQPHQDKSVHADVSADDAVKSGKASDEFSFDGFDQLTVLDSRRYLGFGGDNAKMLTAALGEAGRTLAPYATTTDLSAQATATTVNTLKIQMNPENLGSMTASLRLKGEELSIEVTVDTIEGYRHLSKDHSAIVQSLRDQGFSVDQVSIQLNPSPKTESQQQDQGQNGSNQNLREGQGDAQRQQSGDGRPAPRSERLAMGEVQSADVDTDRSSGASGDGLYL